MTAERPRTVEQRVGDWNRAYQVIRQEMTPDAIRAMVMLTGHKPEEGEEWAQMDVNTVNLGVSMAKIASANDRTAALVSAILTSSGVKVVPTGEDPDA